LGHSAPASLLALPSDLSTPTTVACKQQSGGPLYRPCCFRATLRMSC